MKRRKFISLISLSFIFLSFNSFKSLSGKEKAKILNKSLSDEQKKIMFEEGTERPGSSELNYEKREGFYHCANCKAKLFNSSAKFDSGTGWPSFTESLPGAFKTKIDYSHGMKRTEYHCANCGAHHGHVFSDMTKSTQKRYCNNGLCLIFIPSE